MVNGKVIGYINSETGPRQGCGVGTLAFNLSNQATYEEAVADLPNATAVAITDDFLIVGDPVQAFTAHDRYVRAMHANGHHCVPSKGFVLWPRRDIPCPDFVRQMADLFGLELKIGSAKQFGTYIGDVSEHSEQHRKEFIANRLKKYDTFFERVAHPQLSRHHTLVLLRICARLTPTYWAAPCLHRSPKMPRVPLTPG
jgi:hypothetical protein